MQTPATPPPADGPADEAWLAEAFRQHQASLTTYAFQILGDLESARDAVQDTFMRLCEAETAALRDHVTAWLFTVCRRGALDFLRKGKRVQPLTEDETAPRSDEGPSPAEKAVIFAALDRLVAAGSTNGGPASRRLTVSPARTSTGTGSTASSCAVTATSTRA
ncbi:MAG: sigma-70 family RNA polymerase sigma factor [Verrucomicrobia bacterium]|nr:sigma-70 family RNA polymerase sigma factor [Verrucomicrobiota bacterium]